MQILNFLFFNFIAMKPKNKFQRACVEASKKLPPLTDAQKRWAYTKLIEPVGRRTANGLVYCLDCGEVFYNDTKRKHCTCPNCRTKLYIEDTRKQKFEQRMYATYITACEGLQVIRVFTVDYYAKVGTAPRYSHTEVMQRWIAPSGKYCTLAMLRQTMGTCYIDSWIYGSELELRSDKASNKFCVNVYDRIPVGTVYPRMKLIPELKRTGYKKGFYGQKPKELFCALLTDNRAESLLKMRQDNLLRLYLNDSSRNFNDYWPSIRIAVRNGYKITDATLWCDDLDALRELGKDLHSPKYVCPADLLREHDRYMDKLARLEADREIAENLPSHLRKETAYRKAKARFFGLAFSDGHISVRVLESVRELIAEGKAMHHCVGSYHSKADSLILSATMDGQRLETVEVSISQLKVIQCRGVCNGRTEYHDRIVNLVNRNMSLIQKRIAA